MGLNFSMIDVPHMLGALKIRNITRATPEEVQFSCPFPEHRHGDESPSAYMNVETTAWMCHGCKRKGNAVSFVADFEGISNLQARRLLREAYDTTFREPEEGSAVKEWDTHFQKKEEPVMKRTLLYTLAKVTRFFKEFI